MTVVETPPTSVAVRMVRPVVRSMPSYLPSKDGTVDLSRAIRLDMNESPYGPSPKTRAALATFTDTHRYPDFAQHDLIAALSDYAGVPEARIVAGAGLDDVFATLANLVIDAGDEVLISEPTFGMYRPLFTLHGAKVTDVPLDLDFQIDADAILAAVGDRTKLVVICSPNNPTGNALDPLAIERICREAPCLVAIDEAYAEFAGTTHVDLLDSYDNLAILRTMSKWAGLAGMRVGYGLMPTSLAPFLGAVVPAFHNVGLASSVAAIASLNDRTTFRASSCDIGRPRRVSRSTRRGTGRRAVPLQDQLRPDAAPRGRRFGGRPTHGGARCARPRLLSPRLRDTLRVSIGTPAENERFLTVLKTALREQPHECSTPGSPHPPGDHRA
jgi:histidinol-phosphate aminotransferase